MKIQITVIYGEVQSVSAVQMNAVECMCDKKS